MTDYAAIKGARSTHLRLLAKRTPAHYRWALDHDEDGSDDTASRRFLRAVHCAVLEPRVFERAYGIFDGARGKTTKKDGTPTQYGLWLQSRPGVQALSPREAETILAISASLLAHEDASRILTGPGWSEVTRTWVDQPSGVACRLRADRIIPGALPGTCEIWDLKTVGDVSPDAMRWLVMRRLQVPLQLAHYRAGIESAGKARVVRCGVVAVEDKPPHDVGVYYLPQADLDAAEEQRQELLDLLAECERSDDWPGACPVMTELHLSDELAEVDTDDEEI